MRLIIALFSLVTVTGASVATADNYALPIREHIFDNGLRLLVLERPDDSRVVSKIFTDMGSLNESQGHFGAAHFLEHLMFKGTPTLGSLDWEKEAKLHARMRAAEDALIEERNRARNDLRERGVWHDYQHRDTTPRIEELEAEIASINRDILTLNQQGPVSIWYMANGGTGLTATTEQEYMKFDIDLPADRVELFLRVEADRMQNSVFRNFDAERMVLVEQRLGDLNRPETPYREAMNSLVGRVSMVYQPEGYPNDFYEYTRRYQRELYETYFVPNNTTLIFIGGVSLEEMIPLVERYFGQMERAPEPERYAGLEPLPVGEKRLTWRSDVLAPRVELRFQIPGVGHPDRPAFDVLAEAFESKLQSAVADAGLDARLNINTRVVHTSRFGVPASINLELVLATAADAGDAEAALLEEIERLSKTPLADADVALARKHVRTDWYRMAMDPSRLAFEIGHFEVMDSWRTLKPYLEARDATTPDDLQRLAATYFIEKNRSVGVVLPEETVQ